MSHHYDYEAIYQRPDCPVGAVLGIDPGPVESAHALVSYDYTVLLADKSSNSELLDVVIPLLCASKPRLEIVIESLQSYGMPVGRSVFETAYMIGKLLRECARWGLPSTLYCRQEYARALCGTAKTSDAAVKQALELRFGGYGKTEPLALLRGNSDKRSAYGLAVYWLDLKKRDGRRG